MKTLWLFAILGAIGMFGMARPASAQVIPNVVGIQAFTAEANYMSLPGYLRWQYFLENGEWLSRGQAVALVNDQRQIAGLPPVR